jgi:hypothetical protein
MVYGCGNNCVKYMVLIFNFLVFVIGIAILALSLSVAFSNDVKNYFQGILNDAGASNVNLSQMYIALYVLAAVGGLLMLTGFLGCCGAWCENSCLLAVFFSIILILFVAELGCGIAILVNKDGFKNDLFKAISDQMRKYPDGLSQEERDAIVNMQKDFNCCGCNNVGDYPLGKAPGDQCTNPLTMNQGCCNVVWNKAESQLAIVGGVAIGILVIELLAMIFSCILCQAFRRGDYQYA